MHKTRLALLCLGLALAAGTASAQAVEEVVNSNRAGGPSPFSTVESRRAVTPIPFPTYDNAPAPQAGRGGGAPGHRAGQRPSPEADAEARRLYPDQWDLIESRAPAPEQQGTNFAGTPGVFTQYCENCGGSPNFDFPQRAIGRLFMTTPQGNSGSCSASVITNNIIVTAAHCCFSNSEQGLNDNFVFVPAYLDGAAPMGAFQWHSMRIPGNYRRAPGRANDMCVIRLRPDSAGRNVGFYTGWLGTAWNRSYVQNLHAVGYPGNIGDSETMQLCTAQSSRPRQGCARNNVLNMGCSMTFGASGGPWIINYRGGDFVNSVVSGHDTEECTGTFGTAFNGPRFATANFRALCDGFGC